MPPKTRAEKVLKPDPQLLSTRKVTAISVFLAIIFLISTFYGFNHYSEKLISIPHLHSLTDRIVFTVRFQLIGCFALLFSVLEVSFTRLFTNAVNPLSGNESVVDKANRILTNTLEQFLLNAINQLIVCTFLSENNLKLIPLLSLYFIFGRIAFWIGYKIAPKYRGFGFAVTFIPTLITFGLNAYFLLTTNTNYLLDGGKGFGRI